MSLNLCLFVGFVLVVIVLGLFMYHHETIRMAPKTAFSNLSLSTTKVACAGTYILITIIFSFFIFANLSLFYWYFLQLLLGAFILLYATFGKKIANPVSWKTGCVWTSIIVFCLPVHLLFCWHHPTHLIILSVLSIAHLAITFFVLPLNLSLPTVGVTFLLIIHAIYNIGLATILPFATALFGVLGLGILLIAFLIYNQIAYSGIIKQIEHFKNRLMEQEDRMVKSWAYDLNVDKSAPFGTELKTSSILEEVVNKVTEAISFSDHTTPFYKKDFQGVVNGFREWLFLLKKREYFKEQLLLHPKQVTLQSIIESVKESLKTEFVCTPIVSIEQSTGLPTTIYCDPILITKLLVNTVSYILDQKNAKTEFVKIQLYNSLLEFHEEEVDQPDQSYLKHYKAIAVVISNRSAQEIPTLKTTYPGGGLLKDEENPDQAKILTQPVQHNKDSVALSLQEHTIKHIVESHYGHLEYATTDRKSILLVIPQSIKELQEKILDKLPMNLIMTKNGATKKEIVQSLTLLMDFHDRITQVPGVQPDMIGGIFLLMRRCYEDKKHPTGVLYYVRTISITETVCQWSSCSSNFIYATLLYDLIQYTKLSTSYIVSNFGAEIAALIERFLSVDLQEKYKDINFVSRNFLKKTVQDELLSIFFIKFAERLHDLNHAEGYIQSNHQELLKSLVSETLEVYLPLAIHLFQKKRSKIITKLEEAVKYAQAVSEQTISETDKHANNYKQVSETGLHFL